MCHPRPPLAGVLFFWSQPSPFRLHVLLRQCNQGKRSPVFSLFSAERLDQADGGNPAHTAARAVEAQTQGLIKQQDLLPLLPHAAWFDVDACAMHAVRLEGALHLPAFFEQLQPAGG